MFSSLVTCIMIIVQVLFSKAISQSAERSGYAIPVTKISHLVNADMRVNLDAFDSHVASVTAKIQRAFKNYEKNTKKKHPFAITKRENGVFLFTEDKVSWYGSIMVGSNKKEFTVVFDTGSGWVFAVEDDSTFNTVSDFFLPYHDCESCGDHDLWDPSLSTTSHKLYNERDLVFGDGSFVAVELYTDDVTIASLTVSLVFLWARLLLMVDEANQQTIGAATDYSDGFQYPKFVADGLIGLGFQSISEYKASPVFQTLVDQGKVDVSAFSFCITPEGGELYVGGSNSGLYDGEFTFVDVTVAALWQVNMDNIVADGHLIFTELEVFIDTGATYIGGPPDEVSMVHTLLGGIPLRSRPGYYTYPCDDFPKISLGFGGASFPIDVSTLKIGTVESDDSSHEKSIRCMCGIVEYPASEGLWVIGDVFLLNVYTMFDFDRPQVGFAKLASPFFAR